MLAKGAVRTPSNTLNEREGTPMKPGGECGSKRPVQVANRRQGVAAVLVALLFQGCAILIDSGNAPEPEAPIDYSDPVLNQRRIFVIDNITETTAAKAIRELLFLDGQNHRPIDLYLMTPGGDLKAAFAIEHAMRLIQSRVNTHALGECNSSGALLLAAGTGDRQAFHDATIVIHGMEVKRKAPARYVELTQEAYTAFWRRRARLPESWLPIPPGRIFILTAQQALDYGVIDKIIPNPAEETERQPGPAAR